MERWNHDIAIQKTALSEANVKTNRMGSTKWTKTGVFASNHFIFWKTLFEFKNLLLKADLMYQPHKGLYSYFS